VSVVSSSCFAASRTVGLLAQEISLHGLSFTMAPPPPDMVRDPLLRVAVTAEHSPAAGRRNRHRMAPRALQRSSRVTTRSMASAVPGAACGSFTKVKRKPKGTTDLGGAEAKSKSLCNEAQEEYGGTVRKE